MRSPLKLGIDIFLWILAGALAFVLRLEGWPVPFMRGALLYLVGSLPLKLLVVYAFGLHLQAWSRSGVRDLLRLAQALSLGTLLHFIPVWFLGSNLGIPRSVPLLEGLLAVLLMGGVRLLVRRYWEASRAKGVEGTRVLIVGAGDAGSMVARELLRHPETGLVPVGFVDDDPNKRGQTLMGLKVWGSINQVPQAVQALDVEEVLIAIPSAPGHVVRKVVELARQSGVRYRILPALYEIVSGGVVASEIREVRLEDLLRREPVQLNVASIAGYLEGRVVMVTGAGGSIGSEIVRQLARFRPQQVLLVGRGENSLFLLEQELKDRFPSLPYKVLVADVRDWGRMDYLFKTYRPEVVFHAAAHKHVPLMEANPDEAIFNNVMGTRNLTQLCLLYGVERFVNISTDKAVNPTSVMGASKRVAEMIVAWGASQSAEERHFVSVRFGNVLGSRGSVVPIFMEQIKKRKPVTVTHPNVMRYFMTIPEAAQLVLQAGGLGGKGTVYVLDMGDPVRIVDLAQDMIRLAGLEPEKDIPIVFTGLRPGEKLFEELLTAEDGVESSPHQKIYVARIAELPVSFEELLEELLEAARSRDGTLIRETLKKLVPTYTPCGSEQPFKIA